MTSQEAHRSAPHHARDLANATAPSTGPLPTSQPEISQQLAGDRPVSTLGRLWAQVAPRRENAERLSLVTAFLYGTLPAVGGSAVTVLSILAASWSLLYLLIERPRIRFTTAQKWLVGAYLFFALTTLVSGLVRKDPWTGFVRAVNDWPFLYSLASFSVLVSLGHIDCRRPLARGAAVGSILGFLVGMYQFTFMDVSLYRPSGGAGNSAQFGQAGLILAFLSLLCFSRETPVWRTWSIIGFACGLGSVVVSGSRASALAACVLTVALGVFWVSQREWAVLRRAGAACLLLLLVAAATFPMWKDSSPAQRFRNLANRLDQVDDRELAIESVDQRVIQIRASWKALWRRPWLGYGMQHKMKAISKLEPAHYASVFHHTHIHFLYLDYAVGNGVIGFVSLMLLLAIPMGGCLLPGDPLRAERLYGGAVLSLGFATLGLAGASLGMDIGNTIFACFGTMLAMPAVAARTAAGSIPLDRDVISPAAQPLSRAA